MRQDASLDPAGLVARLRADPLVRDAEVIPGDGPAQMTVLIVPQGFTPGHAFRDLVMRLAGPSPQVALTGEIPRDGAGTLDLDEASVVISQPGVVFRYVPPDTEAERALAGLVREVLTDVHSVSMTDNLITLGCDSVSAMEIVVRIRESYGTDLDPNEVFGVGSLRELAGLLADGRAGATPR
jgi:acyl carrier protein